MSAEDSSSVLTKEELEAAIAEVEALAPGEGSIPSLDDGAGEDAVPIPLPIPVPVPSSPQVPAVGSAEPPPRDTEPPKADPAPAEGTTSDITKTAEADASGERSVGIVQRLLGWLPLFATRSGPPSTPRPPDAIASRPSNPAFRLIDITLDLINRPFTRLSPDTRRIIGIVGIVTLVTSLLSAVLLPLVIPHKDALTFLQQKRVEVLLAPAEEAEEPSP